MKFPVLHRPGAIAAILAVWLLSHTPLVPSEPRLGTEDA